MRALSFCLISLLIASCNSEGGRSHRSSYVISKSIETETEDFSEETEEEESPSQF